MKTLDRIAATGNDQRNETGARIVPNRITCADGFSLSVIAGRGNYCTPRPSILPGALYAGLEDVPSDYPGPYTEVEVGFPSARPEPWAAWGKYAESPEDPTQTVYAYVPVDTVHALIESHGGEAGEPNDV